MESKLWYTSKTLWVNALALIWQITPASWGLPKLEGETLVAVLAVVNLLLRLITKKEITLS